MAVRESREGRARRKRMEVPITWRVSNTNIRANSLFCGYSDWCFMKRILKFLKKVKISGAMKLKKMTQSQPILSVRWGSTVQ